jgi:mannose-6-phosphate isomerase-like protein (cupin superfamily)
MKVVKAWEEAGVTIPSPYQRNLKVLFAPDKEGVGEITFTHALLYPGGQTDYHVHDRPELIYIVSGRGIAVCEGEEMPVEADVVLWIEKGEKHQMINTGAETLKLATVFIPAYTSEQLYARCEAAAKKAQLEQRSEEQ